MPAEGRIPAEILDRLMDNWEQTGVGDMNIRVVVELGGRLDIARLQRAVELLAQSQPILRSHLVGDGRDAYWQIENETSEPLIAVVEDEATYESAFHRVVGISRPFEIVLFSQQPFDRLVVKIAHQIGDGAAVNEIAQQLASIYTRLEAEPDLKLEDQRSGRRDIGQVLEGLPWRAHAAMYRQMLESAGGFIRTKRTFTLPLKPSADEPVVWVKKVLSADTVARIADYGRKRGATLNDMALAGCYRATAIWGRWDGSSALRIPMTVDLRRWQPQSGQTSICNLSTSELPFLGRNLGVDFEDTLARIVKLTKRQKMGRPGLLSAWLASKGLGETKKAGKADKKNAGLFGEDNPPTFTNMGPLDRAKLTFGTVAPTYATMVPPLATLPALLIGISGFDGTLTISARTPASAENDVQAIIDRMAVEMGA